MLSKINNVDLEVSDEWLCLVHRLHSPDLVEGWEERRKGGEALP